MIDRFKTWILRKLIKANVDATPIRHTFTDENRERSAIVRRENAIKARHLQMMEDRLNHLQEIQKMQQTQEKINALESSIYGEDEEDDGLDSLFGQFLNTVMQGKQQTIATNETQVVQQMQQISDEQLEQLLEGIPQSQKAMLSKASDDELKALARIKFPQFDENTVERAIKIFRGI